jgi:FKBP-type peptidyl-prolyl cis-trans isomerase
MISLNDPVKAIATVAMCAGLAFAGCGGGSDSSSSPAVTVANTNGPGPAVRLHEGEPPEKLVTRDITKGSGAKVGVGYEVTLRYVGVSWDGQLYSNSWSYPTPPSFLLGSGQIAEHGFDEGIRGMRVGGRREIILPPKARYRPGEPGTKPPNGKYPPGETLVYVVDLLKAHPDFKALRDAINY